MPAVCQPRAQGSGSDQGRVPRPRSRSALWDILLALHAPRLPWRILSVLPGSPSGGAVCPSPTAPPAAPCMFLGCCPCSAACSSRGSSRVQATRSGLRPPSSPFPLTHPQVPLCPQTLWGPPSARSRPQPLSQSFPTPCASLHRLPGPVQRPPPWALLPSPLTARGMVRKVSRCHVSAQTFQ